MPLSSEKREPGDVPAWPGEAGHEAATHRIAGLHEHDRHRVRLSHGRSRGDRPRDQQHVDLETDELGHELGNPVERSVRMPGLDGDALTIAVPELTQPLPERREEGVARRTSQHHADPGNLRRWPRLGAERRREKREGGRQPDDVGDREDAEGEDRSCRNAWPHHLRVPFDTRLRHVGAAVEARVARARVLTPAGLDVTPRDDCRLGARWRARVDRCSLQANARRMRPPRVA